MNILIVDDNPANLVSLSDTLKHLPAKIISVDSAEKALKVLLRDDDLPVLAILDVQMPIMDGYELAKNIRLHPRTRHIPIIFLSAIYNEEKYINYGYESGAVDFLTKPFNPDILRAKVDVFLNLESYRKNIELLHIEHKKIILERASEREFLQKQIYESQKMKSLGQLASGIAHDFNNIITSILGNADLANMYLEDTPNTEAEHCLTQIKIATDRATALIKQILIYTQQDVVNGGLPELVQPVTVVEDVLQMLQSLLPAKITIETAFEQTPCVMVQTTQLHQLVTHLIVNASDAIGDEETGTIKISVGHAEVNTHHCSDCHLLITGDYVEISVADTGCGISADKITNIFEPFFTTKEVGKGIGLGLSVVSGVTHKINGHILLSSTVGQGTTFRILLPIVAN